LVRERVIDLRKILFNRNKFTITSLLLIEGCWENAIQCEN